MTSEHEHDELARELHATRAQPRPEFARELDERAAGWLRERPRRRLPSLRLTLRVATAAASVAALAMALVIAGGDGGGGEAEPLDVAVVSEGTPGAGQAPQALESAPQQDSAARNSAGAFLLGAVEGQAVTVRYFFPETAKAKVALAGHAAEVTIERGVGSVEISTEGLPAGRHELTITTPVGPTYRQPIEIDG